jgi:hypothetical protein
MNSSELTYTGADRARPDHRRLTIPAGPFDKRTGSLMLVGYPAVRGEAPNRLNGGARSGWLRPVWSGAPVFQR